MKLRLASASAVVGMVLVLSASAVVAGPAAYFRWHSRFNDYTICSQVSPGPGWEILKGPFKDAQCSKPAPPQ
ncbi:hypothetical protein [Undibacterium sp.]|uniref:hypothetical protein n=1 Tax=Undibacterium sp. TaxID=1914977 RepID=UPI00374D6356